MLNNKDFTSLTLEELLKAQQKINGQKTMTAVFIGFLVGISIWSATHKSTLITFLLLIAAFFIGKWHSDQAKAIQAEITRRDIPSL